MFQTAKQVFRSGEIDASKLANILFDVFLLSDVFGGALKYALAKVDAAPLNYLPKLSLLLFPLFVILLRGELPWGFLPVLVVMAWSLFVAYFHLSTIQQGLFGIWTIVPFLFGCWASSIILRQAEAKVPFFIGVFAIAVLGVVLNLRVSFPWVGQAITVGGVSVLASQQLTDYGILRSGGFSNASYDAAGQILALAIWIVVYSKRPLFSILIWLVGGAGVLITTTKGMILSYVLLTGFFVMYRWIGRDIRLRVLWSGVLVAFLLLDTILPLYDLVSPIVLSYHSFVQRFVLESFGDRLSYMWPGSFSLLDSWGDWLSGRGIGGLGDAQYYFEPNREYAGDNIFVYLTVDFGLIVTIGFLLYYTARTVMGFLNKSGHPLEFPFALLLVSYGLVVPVVAWPTLALMFGVMFGGLTQTSWKNEVYVLPPG